MLLLHLLLIQQLEQLDLEYAGADSRVCLQKQCRCNHSPTHIVGSWSAQARVEDFDPATLETAQQRFPAYTVPFSGLKVQKLRPYFLGRTYTDTDAGYLAFFAAMHAVALIGGWVTSLGAAPGNELPAGMLRTAETCRWSPGLGTAVTACV
jgi:hypothetical protein